MIVEFNKKYIDNLIKVYIETFIGDPWNEVWEYDWVLERIEWLTSLPKFKGYLKLESDKVIGSVLGYQEPFKGRSHFEILELFVSPIFQRKGVGKELVDFLESELKKEGVAVVNLLTGLNTRSENFYQKSGYVVNDKLCFMSHDL